MGFLMAVLLGFVLGVAVNMLVVALAAFWWMCSTVDKVQNFDDLEGEGRG